jgi:6-pyruvoyltetrahydropterin/6-carboxytetrahydropterin synthase
MYDLVIDEQEYDSPAQLHRMLKSKLSFPEYYGENLAALDDCLGDISSLVHIRVIHRYSVESTSWFENICRVIARHARTNANIHFEEQDGSDHMYGLKTESSFDAAHFLSDYDGKCENLHGHRWRVVAWIEVPELRREGQMKDMVIDFGDFKHALRGLTEELDHMFIVEEGSLAPETIAALEGETFKLFIVPWRTTSENFAAYFHGKLTELGFPVSMVEVDETPNNCAYYRG